MTCLPFKAYGLALGDVVRLSADGGLVTGLVRSAGHRLLRLLLTEDPDTDRLARTVAELKARAAESGLLSEWLGPRFIAVDLPPDTWPQTLVDAMDSIVTDGRGFWEWSDSRPFAPS